METSFLSLAVVILISNTFALTSSQSTLFLNLTTDQSSLIAFKNTIANGGVLLTNWSINTSICDWFGVSCGTKHRRVTALNLPGLGLKGTIAPHLGNLTFLQSLDISSNNFTGALPSELSKLRRLKVINLGFNFFTGEIPSWFGALSELRRMSLSNNNFSGRIPTSVFNISGLEYLYMDYNFLDGNIPSEIGNSPSMERVSLKGNELSGPIPDTIFNVSSLMMINFGDNRLTGELPNNMCSNTRRLKQFSVAKNKLYGEIPTSIIKCREIELLLLNLNNFTGNIPIEIGSLSKLRGLYLWRNQFKGSIPKVIGNLTSLEVLNLQSNKLTGELPEELSNLPSLNTIAVFNNSLSGAIPPAIFNISTLQDLDLSFNHFSGTLPSNMGLSLSNLRFLALQVNSFSGSIPSSINNASQLTRLNMEINSFSGSIPNFPDLKLLTIFSVAGNNLIGAKSPTHELEFLSSLTNSQHLQYIEVSENPLNGVLPTSIGNLSQSFKYFSAYGASIGGVIPFEIGNLSNLINFQVYGNQLSGSIPTTTGNLRKLAGLLLYDNQLQGSIPIDLCQMSSLVELYLSNNVLEGPIPECLDEIQSLLQIEFSSNKLNSTIPPNFWNLTGLVYLNLSSNYLSGEISSQIGKLKGMNGIYLSSNLFSGDIPSSIEGCQSLEYLYLSDNNFGGSIPQSLGNMRALTGLDLSNNSLSGLIPKSLQDLKVLEYFNVSYNKLEGEIPNGGAFANFTAQSFANNTALCGAPRFEVPPCKDIGGSRSKSIGRLMKYILPSLFSAIVLVIIAVLLVRRWRQIIAPIPVDTSLGIAWRVTSYIELSRATDSFSETNLLGRGSFGSVFKGVLSEGLNIAVKVFNLELEGANKSFETESKILSTIRHRNLIRIIGCCTNLEFKALILEFMPNGSLEKWLYSDNNSLDILQLLNISIDVALALEYLHHGNTFPVVHCDIKPSNVLLDEDMTARVADLGIAKLFEEGEAMVQTKTLATIGYAAPEYGSEGIVSTSADVYSYGILLLEMFTRKKPTDDMFDGEISLKEWVSEALEANAMNQVLAPALLSEEDGHFIAKEECVASVFDLAMKCLVISAVERINMKEAAVTLKKIKAKVATEFTTRLQPNAVTIT